MLIDAHAAIRVNPPSAIIAGDRHARASPRCLRQYLESSQTTGQNNRSKLAATAFHATGGTDA
jgi:hypothetical protein